MANERTTRERAKRGRGWKNAVEGAIVRSSGRFENKNKKKNRRKNSMAGHFSSAITCGHEARSSITSHLTGRLAERTWTKYELHALIEKRKIVAKKEGKEQLLALLV